MRDVPHRTEGYYVPRTAVEGVWRCDQAGTGFCRAEWLDLFEPWFAGNWQLCHGRRTGLPWPGAGRSHGTRNSKTRRVAGGAVPGADSNWKQLEYGGGG